MPYAPGMRPPAIPLKKPFKGGRKGGRKPSSEKTGGGRRKAWLSEGIKYQQSLDVSPRVGLPWWKSPLMKAARLAKAATLAAGLRYQRSQA